MSFQSYKKAIKAQSERERKYNPETNTSKENAWQQPKTEYVYVESTPRKRRAGCLVPLIIIAVILIVAAIKNPSESDGKEMVKNFVVDKVNDKLRTEMLKDENDDNDGIDTRDAFIGITFLPHIFDYYFKTEVNDYFLFSYFDCTLEEEDTSRTIVSGIILFGKIIPLKTDVKPEILNMK